MNPLDPASAAGRPDRDVTRGHGTRALGPGDSSDSGSDVVGMPGLDKDEEETAATLESIEAEGGADGADISTDHVESVGEGLEEGEDAEGKNDKEGSEDKEG